MMQADERRAREMAKKLLAFGANLVDTPANKADEGRSYSMAMLMFVGSWLATLQHAEHRAEFCQAALDYARRFDQAMDDVGAFPGRRKQ